MAKILTDAEMGEIIFRATHDDSIIDDADSYEYFLEALGDLICLHFGAERGKVFPPDNDLPWSCGFHITESVPPDGGIFKDYDTDVTWEDGKESEAPIPLQGCEIGTTLYVPVPSVELMDALERQVEYTQMSSETQFLVDTNTFSRADFTDMTIKGFVKRVLAAAKGKNASHINFYKST